MQAVQSISRQGLSSPAARGPQQQQGAPPMRWITRVFGCWHRRMSRPFSMDNESYRACLDCGAHRVFDPERWETRGPYYYGGQRGAENLRRAA